MPEWRDAALAKKKQRQLQELQEKAKRIEEGIEKEKPDVCVYPIRTLAFLNEIGKIRMHLASALSQFEKEDTSFKEAQAILQRIEEYTQGIPPRMKAIALSLEVRSGDISAPHILQLIEDWKNGHITLHDLRFSIYQGLYAAGSRIEDDFPERAHKLMDLADTIRGGSAEMVKGIPIPDEDGYRRLPEANPDKYAPPIAMH